MFSFHYLNPRLWETGQGLQSFPQINVRIFRLRVNFFQHFDLLLGEVGPLSPVRQYGHAFIRPRCRICSAEVTGNLRGSIIWDNTTKCSWIPQSAPWKSRCVNYAQRTGYKPEFTALFIGRASWYIWNWFRSSMRIFPWTEDMFLDVLLRAANWFGDLCAGRD